MDMRSRNQYLETLLGRHLKVNKAEKGWLLDEYFGNTGQNRKYVIREVSRLALGPPRVRKKRLAFYRGEVRVALEALWKMFGFSCGQRLAPVVRLELEKLHRLKKVEISERTAQKPLRV
jgi:hypothetical protein